MTDVPTLTIDERELVPSSIDEALLRVGGRWAHAGPGEIQLYVPADGGGSLVDALPPGVVVSGDGNWSAAFSVDPEAASARLALVPAAGRAVAFTVGEVVEQPPPQKRRPEDELSERRDIERRLERALEELADAEALVSELRRRCELSERGVSDFRDKLVHAWGEAAEMRDLLESREAAHEAAKESARGALAVVGQLEARARSSEEKLAARRQEMEEQCALLEAEAVQRAETEAARADEAERELAAARERLGAVEQTTKSLATSEQALRQELESLTRTDLGDEPRGIGPRRSKVSVRAYREALAKLEHEQAERARVEEDLRHLLAVC